MDSNQSTQEFTGHLEELRQTLIKALLGLGVGVIISIFFAKDVLYFLAQPIGGIQNLQAIEVTETISEYMRISLLGGLILSLPWIFYQLFQFVGKGLKSKEKRALYISIPFAVILFLTGSAFAYFIMLPSAMKFFVNFLDVDTTIRIKSYVGFVTTLIFWIGCVFELPLIIYILARIGIIETKTMISSWRIAVVIIAILAAAITPTADPVNMSIFMFPLFALYLLSIGLAKLAQKKADRIKKE